MGYLDWITGLCGHGFDPRTGDMAVGGRGQDKSEAESIKKMCPQHAVLKRVKRPLHPDGWPSIHLHDTFFAQLIIDTRHMALPYFLSQLEVILFLWVLSPDQLIPPAFAAPYTLSAIKIVYFELALVVAVGICTADLLLIDHSIVYGAIQSPEGTSTLVFTNHLLSQTNGSSKRTKHFPVLGHDQTTTENILEGCHHAFVQRRPPQKHGPLAYPSLAHNAVKIIIDNGIAKTCYEILLGNPLLMIGDQV